MTCMAGPKFFIVSFISKEGFHPLYLEIHLDAVGQPFDQIVQAGSRLRIRVHRRADRRKQMRVIRGNDLVRPQIQGADKCRAQLREEMKRSTEKRNIAADRLAACQTTDGLVDNRLENGGGQILFGCALIDEGLDIRLGENAAARRDRIDCLVIFRILIKTGCVRLKQRSHLVNKRAGASGADSVHTLVNAAGKINNFRILAAKLDGNVGLRGIILQGCGNRYNLLDKWNAQMLRKC